MDYWNLVWDRYQSLEEASNESYRVYIYRFLSHREVLLYMQVVSNGKWKFTTRYFLFSKFFIHIPFATSMLKAGLI